MPGESGARRNLALYPWYVGGIAFYAWMPVFFLYFASRVSLSEVLALEAIYYLAVVLIEVPSGYFSDEVGRRPTLVIAAASLVGAYSAFVLSHSFWGLAVAQVLLATGLAFNSGTDTSFHYASLAAMGREADYAEREARLSGMSFALGAVAALVGGSLAVLDLRLAYVASGIGALGALGAALFFAPVVETPVETRTSFGRTLRSCVAKLGDTRLRWLFLFSVVAVVVNHVPYEFYQPYLDQLPSAGWSNKTTPLIAGVHVALAQLVAAPMGAMSARSARRLGLVRHLLMSSGIQIALIGLMALVVHPVIAVLLLARSIPRALHDAPLRAAIAPRVGPEIRATYLSLQSLSGRLGFSLLLAALSLSQLGDLSALLRVAALVSVALLVVLLATAHWIRQQPVS